VSLFALFPALGIAHSRDVLLPDLTALADACRWLPLARYTDNGLLATIERDEQGSL
jgi:hypothetical protein